MLNENNDIYELKTYTVAEAAVLLGISKDKLYEYLRAGRIPHLKMGMTRIRHMALVEFLKSMESTQYWESGVAC